VRRQSVPIVVAGLATVGVAFFILPLLGLVLRAPWGSAARSLTEPETLEALRLSLVASLSATGVALVLGVPGSWLDSTFGITLPFTTAGVVMAETFVAMPFLILTVEAGLRSMDRRYEEAARTLGASRWRVLTRVTLPLIGPSLFAGAVLCWARALGEFGATITFAGNFPGITQTMPLAVYLLLETNQEASFILSLVLLLISLLVLIGLRHRWLGSA